MYIKKQKGELGEDIACKYLEESGYEIIERNFKCKQGEIDIICFDNTNNEIVFVEVKLRSSLKYGRPSEAVNLLKQKHIVIAAKYYIYSNKINKNSVRFDVIEILLINNRYKINHIKQAF